VRKGSEKVENERIALMRNYFLLFLSFLKKKQVRVNEL